MAEASANDVQILLQAINETRGEIASARADIQTLKEEQTGLTQETVKNEQAVTKNKKGLLAWSKDMKMANRQAMALQKAVFKLAAVAGAVKQLYEIAKAARSVGLAADETQETFSELGFTTERIRVSIGRTADEMQRLGQITEEQSARFKILAQDAGLKGLRAIQDQMKLARGDFQRATPSIVSDAQLEHESAITEQFFAEQEDLLDHHKISLEEFDANVRRSFERQIEAEVTHFQNERALALEQANLTAQERLDIIESYRIKEETLNTEHALRTLQQEQQLEQARKTIRAQQVEAVEGMFGQMAQAAEAFGKEGFAVYKAFAIAQTVVSTYSAAMKAYESMANIPYVGPVLGAVAAAAVIAFGVAQIAKIASAQPGFAEGGLVPGTPSATDNRMAPIATGEFIIPARVVQDWGAAHFEAYRRGLDPSEVSGLSVRARAAGGFATGGLVTPLPTRAQEIQSNVSVGFLNSREEYRRFQAAEGTRIVIDQLRKRSNTVR